MDKFILKKFAIESRQDLMEKIKNKINTFYIDEDFKSEQKSELYILSNEKHSLSLTNDEFKKRELLIRRIKELSLEQVIEEAAYTWFNRIIAIRYMEINDMLPLTRDNQSLGIRVLSSKENTPDPEILKFTNLMNPDLDIDFKKEKYAELKDDNEKFKYILLLVCKKLGRVIPQVFDGITDYIDILIPDNLLNDAGFITKVINEVPEDNYNQVEIIGWLYQYYNQTEKDRVISAKKTYKKNEIAYATQLFTPDWIVKYMVENSLGKYWLEHSDSEIIDKWRYFIKEKIERKNDKVNPTEITFIDPCCGSGHILVYAFEVFYQMYLQVGYNKNDIPALILKSNIYGLDIDDRAGQLSILSVLLKAREYDKNIFNKEVVRNLNIMSIQESNSLSNNIVDNISNNEQKEYVKYLIDNFKNAKEIGSLLLLEERDYGKLETTIDEDNTIFSIELKEKLKPLIKVANILDKKYDVVVTNPPYLNNGVMGNSLKEYINNKYKEVKTDLFSCFAIRNQYFCKDNGNLGLMTPSVWMFISTFEDFRRKIMNEMYITSFIQLEYSALEEATVPICTFTLKNATDSEMGIFFKLTDFTGGMAVQERKYLEALEKANISYKFKCNIKNIAIIDGTPLSYWLSENSCNVYKSCEMIKDYYVTRAGMITGDNNKFLRLWYEVDYNKFNKTSHNREEAIKSLSKWFPYSKGGEYRKWYGNCEYVVNWEKDGNYMRTLKDSSGKVPAHAFNLDYIFKTNITWSSISSAKFSARYTEYGYLYDASGSFISVEEKMKYYILGLLCSKVTQFYLEAINPTLNFQKGNIGSLPLKIVNDKEIDDIIKNNIEISKKDWDMFETSWDFQTHPLLYEANVSSQQIRKEQLNGFQVCNNLEEAYSHWVRSSNERFNKLKQNEEKLNSIFIDIYDLQEELTSEVEDKDITIRKADKEREIKSLISYAVGCMFGRYSLDKDGLIFAGGDFDNVYKYYKEQDGGWAGASLSDYKYLKDEDKEIELLFSPDVDNIIPITDEAYFGDDIVERFKTFIKVAYGDNTFNANMDFIAEALGKKGTETSEDTIRRYFVNDFFNDHIKIYQKRPIYWLFDSGKKNGFKVLVYMHRYNENLIPKVRLDYLHRIQTTYEKLLSDISYKLKTELSMSDKKAAQNRQADLNAKLQEIKEYDEKIAHIANQRISIDLDDGVKVNYDKFKEILAKIK